MIDDTEKAKRLASAIASDLKLYSREKIAAGEDVSAEIAEARELFNSRVSPELRGLLDEAIAPVLGRPAESKAPAPYSGVAKDPFGTPPSPGTQYALPPGLFQDVQQESAPRPTGRGVLGPALLVMVVAAGALVWLMLRP